jgi:hypothetical protein
MDNFFDDPLGLDPLSPLPLHDPRWFVPAHGGGSSRTGNLSGPETAPAQSAPIPLEVDRLAGEAPRLRRAS